VRYLFALVLIVTALSLQSCGKKGPPLIPREVLFGNPEKTLPQIAPDGMKMAYLAPDEGVMNVWVKTIGKDDDRAVTHDRNRGIQIYFWAEDSRHILYLQDKGGNENWRLYAIDLETGESKDYTPFENVQVRIVARNKRFPNELLIAMNRDNPHLHDVYHLDLTTGELGLVERNPGDVAQWVVDADFKVKGKVVATREGGFDLYIKSAKDQWKKLVSWDVENSLSSGPLTFTRDGDSIYLLDCRDVNAGRLVKMDVKTGGFEVIAEDPTYDVGRVLIHPDSYEIQAVGFVKERLHWQIIDSSIAEDFERISNLDDGDFVVYDRDNADDTWLVGFTKDNGPIAFYAYDRNKKVGTFLFHNRPNLAKYTLARMEPFSFKSRDGLIIHGYITFPPGKERRNLPMVVNVHGGPWYRDSWGYDPEAQWLANRGYICLQVNFRGSTGYGKDFLNAGNKEWGGKMHSDIVDAVKWAIEKGYVDSTRIAIYGASYGGYEALVGATFTPDLFCCAVDVVGPSNLLTWINSIPPYWATYRRILYKRIGDPEKESDFLISRSPLFKVDQIKIPILIAQGANDPRVPRSEAEQIVNALKEKGIGYEYLLFPDEGHGFVKPENRLKFYKVCEKFLAKHLGGRYEKG
jgi:dipeptidyl aminopeptidase/acylaminoacyl peptidase